MSDTIHMRVYREDHKLIGSLRIVEDGEQLSYAEALHRLIVEAEVYVRQIVEGST